MTTSESVTVRLTSYWTNCSRHTHARNVSLRLTDADNAERLDRVAFTCVVRPDDFEDRTLRVSSSLDLVDTTWNAKPFKQPAWRYRIHPRAECAVKVYWDQSPDQEFTLRTRALR